MTIVLTLILVDAVVLIMGLAGRRYYRRRKPSPACEDYAYAVLYQRQITYEELQAHIASL